MLEDGAYWIENAYTKRKSDVSQKLDIFIFVDGFVLPASP